MKRNQLLATLIIVATALINPSVNVHAEKEEHSFIIDEANEVIESFIVGGPVLLPPQENELYLSNYQFDSLKYDLEEFLRVENGQFYFENIPFEIYFEYGFQLVEKMKNTIEIPNQLAQEGRIEINLNQSITVIDRSLNDGGVVTNPITPIQTLSTRNRTARTWHWWGTRNFMSRSVASQRVRNLRLVSGAASFASTISMKAGFVPGGVSLQVARLIAMSHADSIQHRLWFTNHGIIADVNWALVMTTRSQ